MAESRPAANCWSGVENLPVRFPPIADIQLFDRPRIRPAPETALDMSKRCSAPSGWKAGAERWHPNISIKIRRSPLSSSLLDTLTAASILGETRLKIVAEIDSMTDEQPLPCADLAVPRDERRSVEINGYIIRSNKAIVDVKLLDLSYDGCAVSTQVPLVPGEKVKLSALGRGASAATVRWYKGRKAGLQFQSEPVSRQRWPRQADRLDISAVATLRRFRRPAYRVTMLDVTRYGCRTEFIERPKIYEHVWIKFDGLDSMESVVCWVEESSLGLMYVNPIHPAVFDMLLGWLQPSGGVIESGLVEILDVPAK